MRPSFSEREMGANEMLKDWDEVVSRGPYPVSLWDMEEEVEETLVGWLIILPIPPDPLLLSFALFRLELFATALRQLVPIVILEPLFWAEFGLGMGLPSTKRKEFSSSGFKRSSSVVKSKGESEERAKEMLEDWDEVVSGGPHPSGLKGTSLIKNPTIIMPNLGLGMGLPSSKRKEFSSSGFKRSSSVVKSKGESEELLDLVQSAMRPSLSERRKGEKGMLEDWDEVVFGGPYPSGLKGTSLIKNPTIVISHVCQGAMMVILGLFRERNKMEANMMGMGLPSTKRKEFSLSGFKRSLSVVKSKGESDEREKGAKEMLEDWDDVVSRGPHLSWFKGTSLIKNPTIILELEEVFDVQLVGSYLFPDLLALYCLSLLTLCFSAMRFSPPALRHGAEAISSYCYSGTSILGRIWVWGWAYRQLSGRSFHLVGSGPICDATEFVGATEGGEEGCWRIGMKWFLVGPIYNEDFHMRFFFYWVDPPVCQGSMMVILGLLRARNKMEADMMLRGFLPRALRHGAEAISSYCYSGTFILGQIWAWGWA
uniref:Zinc finger, GRF-type n=1 Tax=Tanacetum cinerariifolium TaxID=118510 RepID=A0A6L2L398_TANCI|nr:zinc finger, GRF-type [Tanacetum cinerariifolium]